MSPSDSANASLQWAANGELLSAEQRQQLTEANQRAKRILRAGTLATVNGWIAGLFAAASLLFAIASPIFGPFSLTSLVMAIGLAAIAYNEFIGRRLIRQFDLRGPRRLGWNQLAFIALLVGYSIWCIYFGLNSRDLHLDKLQQNPGVKEVEVALGWTIQQLYTAILLAMYGSLIVLSVVFQGLNSLYYFGRRKYLKTHLDDTPTWILARQQVN